MAPACQALYALAGRGKKVIQSLLLHTLAVLLPVVLSEPHGSSPAVLRFGGDGGVGLRRVPPGMGAHFIHARYPYPAAHLGFHGPPEEKTASFRLLQPQSGRGVP